MKRCIILAITLLCVLTAVGCNKNKLHVDAQTPDTLPPSVMINDKVYYYTGKKMPVEIDESAIMGRITSVVKLNERPEKNGESNMNILGAPCAIYEDGLAVLMDNEWTYFESRE